MCVAFAFSTKGDGRTRSIYTLRDDGPVGFSSTQTSRSIRYLPLTQTVFSLWHLTLTRNLSHLDYPHIHHGDVRHELIQHPSRLLWQRWCWEYPYAMHSGPRLVCLADMSQAAPRKPHCPTLRQDTRTADAVALGARRAQLRAPRKRPSCLATSSTYFPKGTRPRRARRKCCRPWGYGWASGFGACGRTLEDYPRRVGRWRE